MLISDGEELTQPIGMNVFQADVRSPRQS